MPTTQNIDLEHWIRRKAYATTRDTAGLRSVRQDFLNQSVFSATNTSADWLNAVQKQVTEILAGTKNESRAILELGQMLEVQDYIPRPGTENTIQDLSSFARIKLVVETNVQSARGYGQWVAGQEGGTLETFPCWRVIVGKHTKQPRVDWPERWITSARRAGDNDARMLYSRLGIMAARKTSKIWEQLGSRNLWEDGLGNPWPPFFFNSGKVTEDVDYRQAREWKLIKPGAKPQTPQHQEYKPGGNIGQESSPEMQTAVRRVLQRQGFSFDSAGELIHGPVGNLQRILNLETPSVSINMDTILQDPVTKVANRLEEILEVTA